MVTVAMVFQLVTWILNSKGIGFVWVSWYEIKIIEDGEIKHLSELEIPPKNISIILGEYL
jgi:hypothetical protein